MAVRLAVADVPAQSGQACAAQLLASAMQWAPPAGAGGDKPTRGARSTMHVGQKHTAACKCSKLEQESCPPPATVLCSRRLGRRRDATLSLAAAPGSLRRSQGAKVLGGGEAHHSWPHFSRICSASHGWAFNWKPEPRACQVLASAMRPPTCRPAGATRRGTQMRWAGVTKPGSPTSLEAAARPALRQSNSSGSSRRGLTCTASSAGSIRYRQHAAQQSRPGRL